jgi:hypothetical protein
MNGFSPFRPVLSRFRGALGASAVVLAAAGLVGCVGYSTWPPREGSSVPSNPNFNEMRLAMTAALAWTVDRYPPGPIDRPDLETPVAINLPKGVRSSMYRIIVENVSDRAQPLRPDNVHLPIYHITGVTVIGDEATVNIARPVSGWGTDHPVYQGVTLELRGGMFREWGVVGHHVWTPGAMQPPELSFIPDSLPDEAEEAAPAEPAAEQASDADEPSAGEPASEEIPAATEPDPAAPSDAPSQSAPPQPEGTPPADEPAPGANAGAPTWD